MCKEIVARTVISVAMKGFRKLLCQKDNDNYVMKNIFTALENGKRGYIHKGKEYWKD